MVLVNCYCFGRQEHAWPIYLTLSMEMATQGSMVTRPRYWNSELGIFRTCNRVGWCPAVEIWKSSYMKRVLVISNGEVWLVELYEYWYFILLFNTTPGVKWRININNNHLESMWHASAKCEVLITELAKLSYTPIYQSITMNSASALLIDCFLGK